MRKKHLGIGFGSLSAAAALLLAQGMASAEAKNPANPSALSPAKSSEKAKGIIPSGTREDAAVKGELTAREDSAEDTAAETAVVPAPATPLKKLDLARATSRSRTASGRARFAHGSHASHSSHYSSSGGGGGGRSSSASDSSGSSRTSRVLVVPTAGSTVGAVRDYLGISEGQAKKYVAVRKKHSDKLRDLFTKMKRYRSDAASDVVKILGKEHKERVQKAFIIDVPDAPPSDDVPVRYAYSSTTGFFAVPAPSKDDAFDAVEQDASSDQKTKIEQVREKYHTRLKELQDNAEGLQKDDVSGMTAVLTPAQVAKIEQLHTNGALLPKATVWNGVLGMPRTKEEVAEDAIHAVVTVTLTSPTTAATTLCMGVVVGNGLVVTRLHAVDNGANGYVTTAADGIQHSLGGIAAIDIQHDLALLKINDLGVSALPMAVVAPNEPVSVVSFADAITPTLMSETASPLERTDRGLMQSGLTPPHGGGCVIVLNANGAVVGMSLAPDAEAFVDSSLVSALLSRVPASASVTVPTSTGSAVTSGVTFP